jgi:hypothetical protein
MLPLEQIRKIDPKLAGCSDEELIKIRDSLSIFIGQILDAYFKEKQ